MSNLLRVLVIGPGLRRSYLVVNYMVSYSADDRSVTLTMADSNNHNTRIVCSRADAPLYQVKIIPVNSLDTESFSLSTVLTDLAEPEEEEVAPLLQPLEGEDHE